VPPSAVPPAVLLEDLETGPLDGRPAPPPPVRRRSRALPVLLVVLAGLANTAVAFAPDALTGAAAVPGAAAGGTAPALAGQVVHLEAGVLLLLAAPALARGSRLAWAAAIAVCAATVGVDALAQQADAGGLLAAAALAALVVRAAAFRARLPIRSRVLRLPAGLSAALLVFVAAAAPDLPAEGGPSAADRLLALARAAVVPTSGSDPAVEDWAWAVRLGALVVGASLLAAVRPCTRSWAAAPPVDVRRHAEAHGRSSTAPLVALPDTTVVPLLDGRALAGLTVRGGVAVVLGMPVAPSGREVDALAELHDDCERRGLLPVLLGVDERQRHLAEEWGYRAQRIGVEAFLDPATFTTAGKRRSNVRHSVTRAERDGVEVLPYDAAARTPARDAQLTAISAEWVRRKGGPELGLTLGRFDVDRLDEQEVLVAVTGRDTPAERVVAFVTWLPYDRGRQAVLDLMRRAPHCPPGTMEKLVVASLAEAAARGRTRVSLGGVPLASTTPREGRVEGVLGWAYEHGRRVYDAHGLFRFKDKFAPDWEPLFLAVPAGARLPRVAVAVARAFLPPAVVPTALAAGVAGQWASVRARVAVLQRHGAPRTAARCWVPAVVSAALVAVALATRSPLGPLPDAVVAAGGWSAEQVLAGEVWRAATASLLTRDLPMLLAMVASAWLVLGLVQRLLGGAAALATWALGCLVGYLATAAALGLLAPFWPLAAAAARTVDYGPSSGIAAGLALVVVVLRHRTVTVLAVGGLLLGSALHHQVADVEHLLAFGAAWAVARGLQHRAARRGEGTAQPPA
jgi:lysylphosphatidylglycerol synthetase-like protein (DUF2156 family)